LSLRRAIGFITPRGFKRRTLKPRALIYQGLRDTLLRRNGVQTSASSVVGPHRTGGGRCSEAFAVSVRRLRSLLPNGTELGVGV